MIWCFGFSAFLFWADSAMAQSITVGNASDFANAIQAVNSDPTNNYTLNFTSGFSLNQPVMHFANTANVLLTGNSSTIDGVNLYQPLVIDSGTVTLQSLNIVNGGQAIQVNGGHLIDSTGSLQGPVINNSVVEFTSSKAGTYSGDMSGTGVVEILGTGAVTFSGNNSYQGGTFIDSNSTLIGSTTSLKGLFLNKGGLEFSQSAAGTFSGMIIGVGNVEISGTGPITFTGQNTYLGGTIVDRGSQLIGTTDSVQGNITNRGTVQFSQTTSGLYAGDMSGAGKVEISGGGPLTFSGTNSYTGGTVVDRGNTLIGTTTSLQGNIANDGAIQFNQATGGAYAGNLSGAGRVEITGGGNVVFSGLNTYTGGTKVDSGSILSGNSQGLLGTIVNNGAVQFLSGGTGAYEGNMSGTGSVEIVANASATLTGSNSYTGGTTVDSGATLIGTTTSIQGSILDNGRVVINSPPINAASVNWDPSSFQGNSLLSLAPSYTNPLHNKLFITSNYGGNISGTGQVEIGGGGITQFTGSNSYSGGTTVDGGSTLIGSTVSLQGNILNNGFVQFNTGFQSGTVLPIDPVDTSTSSIITGSMYFPAGTTYAGNMSGTGGVEISGTTPILFSGINTYTGGTYIDPGSTLIGATTAVQGNIINDGTVQFDQVLSGTYAGNMSGTGNVIVNLSGPVTFTGTNRYTGGTTVNNSSTLIGTTNSLQGAILNNGLVQFNQSAVGTYAGVMSGSGAVEISGLGLVTFSGTNTYSGPTTIDNSGTLVVNGSIAGPVNVNNGGTLSGTGTVRTTAVNAGGTIAPGTVGAPLTVNGNFVQGMGSSYTAEVNATGSDKIVVTGAAQIDEGTRLNLNLDPGKLTVGKRYELLSAAGGLTGTYASVFASPTSQLIAFTEEYHPNSLQLVVNSNLAQSVTSPNQFAVATILDQTSGTATGAYANTITFLTTLSPGALSGALSQLSGDIYPSIGTIERQTTTVQLQLLSNRLAGLTGPDVSSPTVAQRQNGIRLVSRQSSDPSDVSRPTGRSHVWSTWAQGYGLGGSVAGDGNAGGVNYRLGGTLFGAERWLNESVMIGVLGGYAGTSIGNRQVGSNAQIDAYQVGLYELYRQDMLYISNIDAYGNSSYNTSRPLDLGPIQQTASGTSSGNQWAHYTEGGVTYDLDEFKAQPFLGLQYMYLDQQGATESGAGSFNLTTGHQIVNSVRTSFGGRVYHETTIGRVLVVPSLSARYQHEWGNGTQLISSSFSGAPTLQFVTSGSQIGRDFGLFTLGATAYMTTNFSVYGSVDAQVATNYAAVIGAGGLQYSW